MKIYPNIIAVSGSGRNVGKTALCLAIIKRFAATGIYAIKISPHFHPVTADDLICKSESFQIVQEKTRTNKDSSLMMQAGARAAYYMQVKDINLSAAFETLYQDLDERLPIVIESGAIGTILQPGIRLFVTEAVKSSYNNETTLTKETVFDHYVEKLSFINNQWKLNV